MTGFSIQQPWNELVVSGVKTIEVRGYRRYPTLPMTLAIHAGLVFDARAPLPICEEAAKGGAGTHARRGAITGVATLVEIVRFTPTSWSDLIQQHRNPLEWYQDGLWAWRFTKAIRLAEPVRCRGALGFWSLPRDVTVRVRRMLAAASAQDATRAADRGGPTELGGLEGSETAGPGAEGPKTGHEDAL